MHSPWVTTVVGRGAKEILLRVVVILASVLLLVGVVVVGVGVGVVVGFVVDVEVMVVVVVVVLVRVGSLMDNWAWAGLYVYRWISSTINIRPAHLA